MALTIPITKVSIRNGKGEGEKGEPSFEETESDILTLYFVKIQKGHRLNHLNGLVGPSALGLDSTAICLFTNICE